MIGFTTIGAGPGRVIVLHDWLSDTSTWDGMRPYLDVEHFRWVFADLRGYGRSRGQAGDFTVEEAADDIVALATSLGWPRFAIVGHSMSGLVAMYLAQHRPEMIERVVLVTPSPPRGFGADEATLDALRGAALGGDTERLGVLRIMQGDRLSEEWIGFKLEHWKATADPAAVAGYAVMWGDRGLPEPDVKIAAPVLLITGEQDHAAMRGDALGKTLRPLAPDLEVAKIESSGHCPMQEAPPLTATLIGRFLSRTTDHAIDPDLQTEEARS